MATKKHVRTQVSNRPSRHLHFACVVRLQGLHADTACGSTPPQLLARKRITHSTLTRKSMTSLSVKLPEFLKAMLLRISFTCTGRRVRLYGPRSPG